MSESRMNYTATAQVGNITEDSIMLEAWERNLVLRLRQAAAKGEMLLCDPDSRCWWVTGKRECNKEDALPFRM